MDKGKIAEGLLALVMDRPQAASVVGDLLETSLSRSAIWFWSNVLRTWIWTIWRDAKSQPRFVFGIAALGTLVHAGVALAVGLIFHFSLVGIVLLLPPYLDFLILPTSLGSVVGFYFLSPFYAGRWITHYSHGREIAICVAMVILEPVGFNALSLIANGYFSLVQWPRQPVPMSWWNWREVWNLIPFLLGAALTRRRRQAASAA
jgi:hypothetical protein